MKPLYAEIAEERLKGQPPRHAKLYKDDISVFEGDMILIRDYLLNHIGQSLGRISRHTGIPKATVQKMLSPLGIRRMYSKEQLTKMKERNLKRYLRIISNYDSIQLEDGRWNGLVYRESDRERFRAWLMDRGYMLVDVTDREGRRRFLVMEQPEDIQEEIFASYGHRINRIPI